jgi:hypothetical protein
MIYRFSIYDVADQAESVKNMEIVSMLEIEVDEPRPIKTKTGKYIEPIQTIISHALESGYFVKLDKIVKRED